MTRFSDLKIVVFLLIMTVLFVLLPPLNTTPIRTILGIPVILFLPGYALIAALFPGKKDLDGIERIALSFGLSIAVVPLIGLVLNFTPFGIRLFPVLISISVFTLIMCLITYYRRSRLPEDEVYGLNFTRIYPRAKAMFNGDTKLDKILSVILVLSIIFSVIILVYVIVSPIQGEKFTEFYILGNEGKADNYPTIIGSGNNSSLIVGIVNHEYSPVNYTLLISLENNTLSRKNVQLKHNSTWEERTYFTPEIKGNNLKLDFLLYKGNNLTAPYRDLHLWVNVT